MAEAAATPSARNAGFTLIEILAALVVLGLLVTGLAAGVRFGIDSWNRQSRLVSERDQLDAVDRALRRLLEHLDPGSGTVEARLSGSPDRLVFRTELPSAVSLLTRRADASLYVDHAHRLILRWSPYLHENSLKPVTPAVETELLRGVKSMRLSYWEGRSLPNDPKGWHDEWEFPTPPSLVRVHLVFDQKTQDWPDIIVSPALDPNADG